MLRMEAVLPGVDVLAQIKAVRRQWFATLKTEVREIKTLYDKTTSTWEHDVDFRSKVKTSDKEAYGEVWAENRIYWFVHESISVMRGVLSSDWSPKTQPGVLSSGAGSGRLLYASKKVSKPPYKARKFTEAIIKEREPKFQQAMEKATEAAVRKAAGG